MKKFFHNLIHPEYSAVTDVYVLMFLADTVDFIIIVFGFSAFGVGFTIKRLYNLSFDLFEDAAVGPLPLLCFSFRNIQELTSRHPSPRIRCLGLSWSWF